MSTTPLNYSPEALPREKKRFYIGADDADITAMLETLGLKKLSDLYSHIQPEHKFKGAIELGAPLSYENLINHMNRLAQKNNPRISFQSDGLPHYEVQSVVGPVCAIRGLTTAYTPYQPERSQGTLMSLWIYQSLISQLTGFEAVNASLYERSTCLFEALLCSQRLVKGSNTVVVADTLYPRDLEVLETHASGTNLKIIRSPMKAETGMLDIRALRELLTIAPQVSAVAFPQINALGNLEDVDTITDICHEFGIKAIAVVDPMLLTGLKPPVDFGKKGTDMVVAEGQHLALGPNFGGPGLGIFAIRYNDQDKNSIRSTAGRFVGHALDSKGRECKALILSTREQHIRREKATSNICSNQSFVASLAGACLLSRGDQGLTHAFKKGAEGLRKVLAEILQLEGVQLKFQQSFHNEVTLKLSKNVSTLISEGVKHGLHIGVDISDRYSAYKGENLLLVAVTDVHSESDLKKLSDFFRTQFKPSGKTPSPFVDLPAHALRRSAAKIPKIEAAEIVNYYQKLGQQNLSPDEAIYPLGSCTMKYNPYINDYAASLPGFTNLHPEAPLEDAQGALEVLWGIQEAFKAITGLAAVTTQPVAGAQGELVGLKMFQAYHRSRGEAEQRQLILIPRSAHGTNPATATMAGYETYTKDGKAYGIVLIEADEHGLMNIEQIKEIIKKEGTRIAGVMVTNPNTAGVFETSFAEMSRLIHEVGGLVYMDGANMNAIAGVVNLEALGVDAVHNNLHKTWTIPHGGGGPGDGIVAVSKRLVDFMPGVQVEKKTDGTFTIVKPRLSCGSFHRHFGNFAHKVRAYTYILALGAEGVTKMSSVAVLSARYLYHLLKPHYPTLPFGSENTPRMHEFILTLSPETFAKIEKAGISKAFTIARIGKLFLDFGFHAPTVAFPEPYGLMIEPTETYSKEELDKFATTVKTILELINNNPEVLNTVPHFTPIDRVDEVSANKAPVLAQKITAKLPPILPDRVDVEKLRQNTAGDLCQMILKAHKDS